MKTFSLIRKLMVFIGLFTAAHIQAQTVYYVKTTGTGDGSSWENAMSNETFAERLPNAPDGATFHIAEGTYRPVYDKNGGVPALTRDKAFLINGSVSLIGGYPLDITDENIQPDPVNYKATFDGNIDGELVSNIIEGTQNYLQVRLSGLYITNSINGVMCHSNHAELYLDNTTVSNCECAIYTHSILTLEIENSIFYQNNRVIIDYNQGDSKVTLKNVILEDNNGTLIFMDSNLTMDNVTAIRNKAHMIECSGKSDRTDLTIKNSNFTDNQCDGNLINLTGGHSASETSNLTITDTKFINNISHNTDENENGIAGIFFDKPNNSTLTIKGTTFSGNKGEYANLFFSAQDVEIDNCIFSEGEGTCILYSYGFQNLKFSNSTVYENVAQEGVFSISGGVDGQGNFINNTFAKNEGTILLSLSNRTNSLINNTIVGNKLTHSGVFIAPIKELTGNIILGNIAARSQLIGTFEKIEYNIMPILRQTGTFSCTHYIPKQVGETNIFVEPSGFTQSMFDVLYSDNCLAGRTRSEVYGKINIGEIPYLKVLEGTHNESTGLFNPSIKDNGGFTPTVALKNTILPNGKKVNSLPTSISNVLFDQRNVERNVDAACIGAYENTQVQQFEYYVKESGAGLMDGTLWENAMSNEIFAGWLLDAPDGVTFHIAEGIYKPVYDRTGNVPADGKQKIFFPNSAVTLIGGYDADITDETELPDPKKYETIFSGDILGNDIPPTKNTDGSLNFGNMEDNLHIILTSFPNIVLENIVFQGATTRALDLPGSKGNKYINYCVFRNNNGEAIQQDGGNLLNVFISNSHFYQNKGNDGVVAQYSGGGNMSIESSTFNDNQATREIIHFSSISGTKKISNTTFTNNTATNIVAGAGSLSLSYNNTFINNNANSTFWFYYPATSLGVVGNIFMDNVLKTYDNNSFANPINSQHNLYLSTEANAGYINNTDLFIDKENIVSILDGTWDGTNFAPNLKDNGGFTPTVALTSTLMPGGNEFVNSVPTDISGIFKDQRGVNRGNPACIGAYEYYFAPCEAITASLSGNPITSESHTLTLTLTKPARTKIYLLDKGGNRINSIPDIVNESYSTGTHEVRLNDLFRRNLDPLTPYILVIETDEQKSFMYLYVSKI